MRTCSWCRSSLPKSARIDASFCSGACRTASHRAGRRATSVPGELVMLNRWVRRSARKVPLTVAGRFASSTDPRTWGTWSKASASAAGVGLGFALNGDGIVCLDLDHCLVDDRIEPWAARVLELCPGTYVEVSPSGSGLHIWGRAVIGSGRVVKVPGGAVEIYGSGRYITVTGQSFAGAPSRLGNLSTAVTALLG